MVEIIDFDNKYYSPPGLEGLDKLVLFPDGEYKREKIPNSSVWIFKPDYPYCSEILADDVGCGMAAFALQEIDAKGAADKFCKYLKGKNILGRGNHFVDVCSEIDSDSIDVEYQPHNLLILHTDGKSICPEVPKNFSDAQKRQKIAEEFRLNLGYELAGIIKSKCDVLGNWTHNSVEETNFGTIYRKGAVKVTPEKIHILPAHLGAKIWIYTVDKNNLPPLSSMPHATGRSGPKGEKKVSIDEVRSIRDLVYVPKEISDSSLRTEHSSCYNGFGKIIEKLGSGKLESKENPYIVSIGTATILSYVGKV